MLEVSFLTGILWGLMLRIVYLLRSHAEFTDGIFWSLFWLGYTVGDPVEVGKKVRARVLDVVKTDGIVDLTLRSELFSPRDSLSATGMKSISMVYPSVLIRWYIKSSVREMCEMGMQDILPVMNFGMKACMGDIISFYVWTGIVRISKVVPWVFIIPIIVFGLKLCSFY